MKIACSIHGVVDLARWVLRGDGGVAATVQTLLSRLLILVINIVTGVITARILGSEGRGEQAALILWPQFLAYSITLGLPSALLYNMRRYSEQKSKLISAALVITGGLGLIATAIGIIFIPQWLDQYSLEVVRQAQQFMVMSPLILISTTLLAALEAENEFTLTNRMRYLMPLATLTMLGALALTKSLTPWTAGLTYLLPTIPITLWLLAHFWKRFRFVWYDLGKAYKLLTSYGIRSYGVDLVNILAMQLDQVLVVGLLSPTSMGMYAVTLSLSRMMIILQNAIVTVLFPKAVNRSKEDVVALTGQAARLSMVLLIPIAVTIIWLGPILLGWFYGTEFLGAVLLLRLLVVEALISSLVWILAQAFMALGRPGTATLLQGLGLGISVPIMLLLIPVYGLEGIGFALLLSTTVRLFFVLINFPLSLKVNPPSLIVTQEDWHFLKRELLKI